MRTTVLTQQSAVFDGDYTITDVARILNRSADRIRTRARLGAPTNSRKDI